MHADRKSVAGGLLGTVAVASISVETVAVTIHWWKQRQLLEWL